VAAQAARGGMHRLQGRGLTGMLSKGARARHGSVPVVLIVLLVLFIVAGLLAIGEGARAALRHGLITGAAVTAFGLFFLSFPLAVLGLLMRARREERQREERRQADPARPWNWRDDFVTGIVHPESDPATGFAAGFSLFWAAAASAGGWAGVREFRQTHNWRFLIALVFPAVGAALLLWSAARVRRWFWYRRSVLRLERTPAEIGGWIQGGIFVPRRLEPLDGFQVSLTCSRRIRDADGDTDESVLWQDRVCVPGAASSYPEAQTRISVSIPIPEDCEPWDDETPDRQVVWQLRVTAKIPGAPRLDQVFDAPVFRTRPEDPDRGREALPDGFLRAPAQVVPPARPHVRIEPAAGGAVFLFPAAGGRKSLFAFMIGAGLTLGFAWWMGKLGVPLIFSVALAAFGLVPTLVFLWSGAGEVRIFIGAHGVELVYGLLGFRKSWKSAPGEVLEAGISVLGSQPNQPFHTILLRRRKLKPLWVLAPLADRSEAEWIASEINRRL